MNVIHQTPPEPTPLAGVAHATWAGQADGLSGLSLWRQTLAPGAATPPHAHDCDEVVLCLSGRGTLYVDGRTQGFGANETLVLPRGSVHQIINTGAPCMEILGVFGGTPVATMLPDGEAISLPWRT